MRLVLLLVMIAILAGIAGLVVLIVLIRPQAGPARLPYRTLPDRKGEKPLKIQGFFPRLAPAGVEPALLLGNGF